MERYYNSYKEAFFEVIDKKLYQKLQLNITVDRLLDSYKYYKEDKVEEWMKTMEMKLFGEHREDDPDWDNIHKNKYRFRFFGQRALYWYISFWHRRDEEGNLNTVRKILKKVQKHYE